MQSHVFTGVTSLFVLLQPKTRQMEEPEDHPILEDLKSRIILCSKLGLTTQLDTLLGYYKAFYLRRTVPIPYPFLIGDQERFLRELFPTPYMQPDARAGARHGGRALVDYEFDLVPRSVLETWNQCTEHSLFSDYEIWTAERRAHADPVLIGRRREHPFAYLIARWGDALLSWEQLARQLPRSARATLEMSAPPRTLARRAHGSFGGFQ